MALVVVMVVMVLLLGIGGAIHTGILGDTSMRGAHARSTAGFYAAEAGINRGMGEYRNIFLNYNVPDADDFTPRSFQLGPRQVRYQLRSVPICDSNNVCRNPSTIVVPAGQPFAGLTSSQFRYTANSTSEIKAGDIEASIGTQFNIDTIPIFQFLAFYANALEIEPGPMMTLHGPIHTNGDLYLNSGNVLTIEDLPPQYTTVHISAAGNVVRGRLDQTDVCTGTVRISRLTDTNNDGRLERRDMPCAGAQSSSQLAPWLGAITARQSAVQVPPVGIIRQGGSFWANADLRIALNLTATDSSGLFPIVVLLNSGAVDDAATARLQRFMREMPGRLFYNDVPQNVAQYTTRAAYTPPFPGTHPVYGCPQSASNLFPGCAAANMVQNELLSDNTPTARRGGFYNNRERAWVRMLSLNVHDLLLWNRAQPAGDRFFFPDDDSEGGIVLYLTVVAPPQAGVPNPRHGARVFGSRDFDFTTPPVAINAPDGTPDPTGVSVVSDLAMYVEGHYNIGTAATGRPKQPAALIGDTLNVLSQNWWGTGGCKNDCQSFLGLNNSARDATNTTILAAFIAGVDRTTAGTQGNPGSYNGGLENYPRFHEDWSGDPQPRLTYRGSFVSLGRPQVNNGPWCGTGTGCNIYNPPVRDWDFDVDFLQPANLPPVTPRFVSVQQIRFTENFR
jgi:hypothetical protein